MSEEDNIKIDAALQRRQRSLDSFIEEHPHLKDEVLFVEKFLQEAAKKKIMVTIISQFSYPTKPIMTGNSDYCFKEKTLLPHQAEFGMAYDYSAFFYRFLDVLKANTQLDVSKLSAQELSGILYDNFMYAIRTYDEYYQKYLDTPQHE